MNKNEKTFNDLMNLLDQVPTVKEHMNKFEVQMAREIMLRRAKLGLTQTEVVKLVQLQGDTITQKTISKVESGEHIIESETYEKILRALGVSGFKIDFEFMESSSSGYKELLYTTP